MEKINKEKVIQNTKKYVREELEHEGSGHDWWHIVRVRNNAMMIASKEKGSNLFVVELGALLHDIADWKTHGGDTTIGPKTATKWLKSQKVDQSTIDQVCTIINEVTFKGAYVKTPISSLETKIVQDADRLDAIGAIGIARTFTFGGNFKRPIHTPEIKPTLHKTFKSYSKNYGVTQGSTINHFYEKLLLLKDRMNTKTAKKIATGRTNYMKQYLSRFYKEWDGKL
jgi:uncharacterized protein